MTVTHLIRKLKPLLPVRATRYHTYCGIPVAECHEATPLVELVTCEACAKAVVAERSKS